MATGLQHTPGSKPAPGLKLSYQEFLEAQFDHDHYEWVDGEVIEMAAVEEENNRLAFFVARLLADYVDARDGGDVFLEPFQMHLAGHPASGRAPDVQVVLKKNAARVTRLYTDGPADLVVEVTSAGSRTTDRRDKFREYRDGGVPEYWILDPLRKRAEFFVLEQGAYVPGDIDDDNRYRSRVLPGVWFDLDWFWTRPPKTDVLKLWGVL